MSLNTVALEMVPPNSDRSLPEQLEEAQKYRLQGFQPSQVSVNY